MTAVDAHQHFWHYDPVRDAWIDDSMSVLRRDFLPADLGPLLRQHDVAGCVAVQADQSEAETEFLLRLADENPFILGVVGWVDLRAEDVADRLAHYAKHPKFKGVRHIAQAEADDFLTRDDVRRGIAQLQGFGLTYDILVYAHQLPAAVALARKFPEQRFVLDHLAKPRVARGLDADWYRSIRDLGACANVYCKLSGLVTETDGTDWRAVDFTPFLDAAVAAFGPERLMYGSDWPVCLLGADYGEQIGIIRDYLGTLSPTEQSAIMGDNARTFYQL